MFARPQPDPLRILISMPRAAVLCALMALVIPLFVSTIVLWSTPSTFEATTLLLMNPSRSSQAIVGSSAGEQTRSEQITYDQVVKSQLSIITSEDVVKSAISSIVPAGQSGEEDQSIYKRVSQGLFVTSEPNSFIIKVAFRYPSRSGAETFVDALVREYRAKRATLYSNTEAQSFYSAQSELYQKELKKASKELDAFSRLRGMWDPQEQRKLALAKFNEAEKLLATTEGEIHRKESETASVRSGIAALKLKLALPPEIYGAVGTSPEARLQRKSDEFSADPPLLNVRLYQQMAEKLVNNNADIAGLKAVMEEQKRSLEDARQQLEQLSLNEEEFGALKRKVAQTEDYLGALSKRAIEAGINIAWDKDGNFSSVQVLQKTSVPPEPIAPKPLVIIAAGLVAGVLCALVVLYLAYAKKLFKERRQETTATVAYEVNAVRAWRS